MSEAKITDLIDSPEKWTKGDFAIDENGCAFPMVDTMTKGACCWCVEGARRQLGIWAGDSRWRSFLKECPKPGFWNDNPRLTYEEFRATLLRHGL